MMAKLFCEAGAVISHFVFIAEIMVLGHLIFHAVVCYFDFFTQVDKYLLLQIYFLCIGGGGVSSSSSSVGLNALILFSFKNAN